MTPTQRTLDPGAGYDGWVRVDSGPWLVACSAATAGGCWDLLLRLPKAGKTSEKCVLAAGRRP